MTNSEMSRAAYRLSLHSWKKLEMEEQAEARKLMRFGVVRMAYVPYAPGEYRVEPMPAFTLMCQVPGMRCTRAPLSNQCIDCGRVL